MVAHALHRHSESLVNELERLAHRVIQEVIKNQYSPSGPILGTHRGEAALQSRPLVSYSARGSWTAEFADLCHPQDRW